MPIIVRGRLWPMQRSDSVLGQSHPNDSTRVYYNFQVIVDLGSPTAHLCMLSVCRYQYWENKNHNIKGCQENINLNAKWETEVTLYC